MPWVKRVLGVVLLALATVLVLAYPLGAQGAGERITDYDVDMQIAPDGLLSVREEIVYDFGPNERHGIQRDLVRKERYDGDNDRKYDIDVRNVTTSAGTPDDVQLSQNGDYLRVRIGDPDRTITGRHTYTIDYTIAGALLPFDDHDELNWDAIGNQWSVPIEQVSVRVEAPAELTQIACFSGPQGSTLPCTEASGAGAAAVFGHSGLGPNSGLTVVAGIPKGVIVPEPQPILAERRTLQDAFEVSPTTLGAGGGIAILGVGAAGMLAYRRGRDRRWTGSPVDAALGNLSGAEERIPLGQQDAGTVEFVPPDKIRPGQVGTLIDEQANLLDVTASIVDLAVRGYLRIAELDEGGRDYELTRTKANDATLLPYEALLLDSLFASGPTVTLSELKYEFTAELSQLKQALYEDAVSNGWYRVRPDHTRLGWRFMGVAVTVVGIGLTALVAATSSFGIIPLAVVLTGLVLLALGGRMPARTGKGSAMLSRVRGFRRLFDEGEEDVRARFAEQQGIFSQYLPYAIVFGCTEKWARAFEGLSAEQLGATGWYSGPNLFSAYAISSAMSSFETTATGTLYASQPSSSSASGFSGGFSGGGGGGGGGSSW
jgi:hypothetical protein